MKKTFFISLVSIIIFTSPAFSTGIFNPNESSLLTPPAQIKAKHSPTNYIIPIDMEKHIDNL